MTRRNGGARVGATHPFAGGTRPFAALISAALLLLSIVAGVGGVGGLAALGKTSAAPVSNLAAPSTNAVPVAAASTIAVPVARDRRAAPALGTSGSRRHTAGLSGAPEHGVRQGGWALHHPEAADLPASTRLQPGRLVELFEAEPAVIALTVQVSHRGRAPPAGSHLT